MEQSSPTLRYSPVARMLHWLTVALLVIQFGIAWTMPDVGRGTRPIGLIGWHRSVGASILVIALLRLAVRPVGPAPAAPDDLSPALAVMSRLTHAALYALLMVLPMLGWINANARGWPVRLFGAIRLPALIAQGALLGMWMGDLHGTIAILLLVVIGFHVIGASYHAFILKDRTLQRML